MVQTALGRSTDHSVAANSEAAVVEINVEPKYEVEISAVIEVHDRRMIGSRICQAGPFPFPIRVHAGKPDLSGVRRANVRGEGSVASEAIDLSPRNLNRTAVADPQTCPRDRVRGPRVGNLFPGRRPAPPRSSS